MVSYALAEALDLTTFWEYREVLLRGLAFNIYTFVAAASVSIAVGLIGPMAMEGAWRGRRSRRDAAGRWKSGHSRRRRSV